MFQKGDYVIYGTRGVCCVQDVGTLDISGISKDKLYYTLIPCYTNGSTVYSPVDSNRIVIRPVMSHDEAMELIRSIPEIEELWIRDERNRENTYRDVIKSCDNVELVRIIKTIYNRGQLRIAAGKKATVSDEKYFRIAEENLYGELAISLNVSRDEVRGLIVEKIQELVPSV